MNLKYGAASPGSPRQYNRLSANGVSVPSQQARGSESSATTTIAATMEIQVWSSFHAIMAFAELAMWQGIGTQPDASAASMTHSGLDQRDG